MHSQLMVGGRSDERSTQKENANSIASRGGSVDAVQTREAEATILSQPTVFGVDAEGNSIDLPPFLFPLLPALNLPPLLQMLEVSVETEGICGVDDV